MSVLTRTERRKLTRLVLGDLELYANGKPLWRSFPPEAVLLEMGLLSSLGGGYHEITGPGEAVLAEIAERADRPRRVGLILTCPTCRTANPASATRCRELGCGTRLGLSLYQLKEARSA